MMKIVGTYTIWKKLSKLIGITKQRSDVPEESLVSVTMLMKVQWIEKAIGHPNICLPIAQQFVNSKPLALDTQNNTHSTLTQTKKYKIKKQPKGIQKIKKKMISETYWLWLESLVPLWLHN